MATNLSLMFQSVDNFSQMVTRTFIGVPAEPTPKRLMPLSINGYTLVSSLGEDTRPVLTTQPSGWQPFNKVASVLPPTVSTAPAHLGFNSAFWEVSFTNDLSSIRAAPRCCTYSSAFDLPLTAITSYPAFDNMEMAILPTPPVAPVTTMGPAPGCNFINSIL